MSSSSLQRILLALIAILAFAGAALYNHYPIVTSDTGTYINSAFSYEVARDRPFGYSLLILLTSLKFSLWFVVFAQSILLYILCRNVIRVFLGDEVSGQVTALIIVILVFITGVSWYTSSIMPDIFTSIGGLSAILFLHDKPKNRVWYAILFVYALTVHTSHLMIFTLLFGIIFLLKLIRKSENLRPTLQLLVMSLVGWLVVPSLHFAVDQSFSINKSTHVFLTGRLIETGTLQRYLRNNCDEENFALCQYKDNLPNRAIDFIWDENSALYKTDGWEDPKGEYKKMVRSMLLNPKYSIQFLVSSVFSSMVQVVQTDVGDGYVPQVENSNPYWKVVQFYPYELPMYLNDLQNTSRIRYAHSNFRYQWIMILTVIGLLWLFLNGKVKLSTKETQILTFVILLIVCNAFVTATFGNVLARLQSRVIWLLPFVTMLLYWKYGGKRMKGDSFTSQSN